MIKCNKCKIEKDIFEFYNLKRNKDSRMTICKECYNRREKARRDKKIKLKDENILTFSEVVKILNMQGDPSRTASYVEKGFIIKIGINKYDKQSVFNFVSLRFRKCEMCNKNLRIDCNSDLCQVCRQIKRNQNFRELVNKRRQEGPNRIEKKCSHCGTIKSIEDFYKGNKRTLDGRSTRCKACEAIKKKEYLNKNSKKINKYEVIRKRIKRKNDPVYRVCVNLRSRIKDVIYKKGFKKESTTGQMLGCTWEEFKIHMEKQFIEGMTWNNYGKEYGKWNIDHIVPLNEAKTIEDVYKLNHYTNLQPLWAEDNREKSTKLEWTKKQ